MLSLRSLLATRAPAVTVLVRLIVGGVFLSEGIQKFLFPAELGPGRFAKIGIPWPEATAPFVGTCETLCGALIVLGLLTRPAAAVMLINITVAILSTKVPLLAKSGFWAMAHEARTDWAMLLGSTFLFIAGAGRGSPDAAFSGRKEAPSREEGRAAAGVRPEAASPGRPASPPADRPDGPRPAGASGAGTR
jgi:putative oxidoreductase